MTADNRTSVQIVADALRSMPEAERDDDRDPAVVVAEYAVAALVAAQGAAAQAESEQPWNDPSDPNSPQFDSPWEKAAALIRSIRCAQWDILERRDQEDVRDEINGLIDRLDELATTMLAATVLPSSGVDEDALAEVVREAEAQALEGAAEDVEGIKNAARDGMNKFGPYPWHAAEGVAAWLRARAAEYRKGEEA